METWCFRWGSGDGWGEPSPLQTLSAASLLMIGSSSFSKPSCYLNLGVNDSSIVIRACSDPELTDISISDPLEVREDNISGSNILLQVRKASARLLIICKIAITTLAKFAVYNTNSHANIFPFQVCGVWGIWGDRRWVVWVPNPTWIIRVPNQLASKEATSLGAE